jgi:hypothetical protein
MDTEKMVSKLRGRPVSSNVATHGKNSNAGSRGPSQPRTRQGTPVNIPNTPSATDQTLRSRMSQ